VTVAVYLVVESEDAFNHRRRCWLGEARSELRVNEGHSIGGAEAREHEHEDAYARSRTGTGWRTTSSAQFLSLFVSKWAPSTARQAGRM